MNKQQLIKNLGYVRYSDTNDERYNYYNKGIDTAISFAKKLAEPEKPVVPQFVADWYEDNKDAFEYNVYDLSVKFHEYELDGEIRDWFDRMGNKPIETLVLMHKFGYEVEKEKLYTAKVKFIDDENYSYLNRNFGACEPTYSFGQKYNHPNTGGSQTYFDRDELEEILVWDNLAFEVEEVEE